MQNIIIYRFYRMVSLLMLAGMLANIGITKTFMNVYEAIPSKYAHNLQTLCNEIGTLSYATINKFETVKQIVNELKKSMPTKLYPKVFKEDGVDFTALGEIPADISLDVKKNLYTLVAGLEAFRENKLIELKKRILTLHDNYTIDKQMLQTIEHTIKQVASHGTTEQMLVTFYEQERKLTYLENPGLPQHIDIIYVEETLPTDTVAKPSQKPVGGQGQGEEPATEEHPEEEEEKEHKTERQQDDHLGLNNGDPNGDVEDTYRKLAIRIKRIKITE